MIVFIIQPVRYGDGSGNIRNVSVKRRTPKSYGSLIPKFTDYE